MGLFQFVNSFLSLFYIAFYLRDQEKLKEQLAGLLISRQIIGNLRESAIPYFMEQLKLAKLSFSMWGALSPTQEKIVQMPDGDYKVIQIPLSMRAAYQEFISIQKDDDKPKGDLTPGTPKRSIGQAEIESTLYKYDGTFADHLEILVQMGYVVLFSAAFPLAGVCALLNNLLEIRSDAFKLAHVHQRPFGQRVANIGTWQNAVGFLGLAAVIVNCALIGLSGQVSRLWPGLTSTQTIILIVALEHVMLGLRSALKYILPELPSWLAAEIARAEHCRHEIQCKGTSPRPSPPSPLSASAALQEEFERNASLVDTAHLSEENLLADANRFHSHSPLFSKYSADDYMDSHGISSSSIEAEVNIHEAHNREITPDSPIVQVRQLNASRQHDENLLDSYFRRLSARSMPSPQIMQALQCTICHLKSHHTLGKKITITNLRTENNSVSFGYSNASAGSSMRIRSQPIKILEIPPYRKNQIKNNPMAVVNPSPPRIPEIPAFKARKSNEWQPPPSTKVTKESNEKTITQSACPDWMQRLKTTNSATMHRSHDCLQANKDLTGTPVSSDPPKAAPSWIHIAEKPDTFSNPNSPPRKTPTEDESKGN